MRGAPRVWNDWHSERLHGRHLDCGGQCVREHFDELIEALPGSPLPARNFEAPNFDSLGLMDFNNGNGGNYQLSPTSPFKNAGTDGKDPGADMDGLQTATAGVL